MVAVQRESNELVFRLCMRVEAIKLVDQFLVVGVLDDFGDDITKSAGERGELVVGRIQEFSCVKRWTNESQGWEMDLHAKVDDDDITIGVVGVIADVLRSFK